MRPLNAGFGGGTRCSDCPGSRYHRVVKVVAFLVAGAAVLFGLHHLALWMERRGWLYYLHSKPSRSSLGNAFLEVQSLLDPSAEALVELRHKEQLEDEASGDPPDSGDPRRGAEAPGARGPDRSQADP